MTKRTRPHADDDARARRTRELARHLALENHRLHALNCPVCQSDAFIVARMDALVKRILEDDAKESMR